jgi:pyruvate dehydrogenase E1 component
MVEEQIDEFYYITLLNENYAMPGLKKGTEEQIIKGMYLLEDTQKSQVQLLGSGTILQEVRAAKELLEKDWNIQANVWSCPSFNELAREGQDCDRWNLLHPVEATTKLRLPYVTQQLSKYDGPVVASTDYMKLLAEQIRPFIPKGRTYRVLGTDGFGRSDSRVKLREHFEVNRYYVVIAALKSLADDGRIPATRVAEAIKKYGINADKINPLFA